MPLVDEKSSTSQAFLEQLTEPIFQATQISKISLRPRLMFDSDDEVHQNVFTKTDRGRTLHPDYLPSREILVEWVHRLKARHKRLETFILDLTYSTLEADASNFPTDNTILKFEYHDVQVDMDDYERPVIHDNMDLRDPRMEADSRQFRYTVYPEIIHVCYERLVREAEALREQEALEAAAARDEHQLVALDNGATGDVVGDSAG